MRSWGALAFGLVAFATTPARGQTAPPITDSNYTMVYYQGPITSASRVIGLGGAYTAMAEWCEGEYSNTASPAVRAPYSLSNVDYDLCLGFTSPGAFGTTDFENAGNITTTSRFQNSATFNAGLQMQYGPFGTTVLVDTYSLTEPDQTANPSSANITRVTGSAAASFLNGHLLIGVGFRALVFDVSRSISTFQSQTVFQRGGSGLQVGAIFMPAKLPFRLGATLRQAIDITDVTQTETSIAAGRILPSRLTVPWEVEFGAALELGRRPFNPEWINPALNEDIVRAKYQRQELERALEYERIIDQAPEADRETVRRKLEWQERFYADLDRQKMEEELTRLSDMRRARTKLWDRNSVVLLVSFLITGSVLDATSLTGVLDQKLYPYAGFITVSPRIGMETELVKNWVIGRTGMYVEPSLYEGGDPRAHFTGGVDIKLFKFNPLGIFGDDPWRIRLAADGAARYFNTTFSLGKYH